jgi:hypothetical protein
MASSSSSSSVKAKVPEPADEPAPTNTFLRDYYDLRGPIVIALALIALRVVGVLDAVGNWCQGYWHSM